ncbi:unnamed protein product [Phaeothamnion confervicola]
MFRAAREFFAALARKRAGSMAALQGGMKSREKGRKMASFPAATSGSCASYVSLARAVYAIVSKVLELGEFFDCNRIKESYKTLGGIASLLFKALNCSVMDYLWTQPRHRGPAVRPAQRALRRRLLPRLQHGRLGAGGGSESGRKRWWRRGYGWRRQRRWREPGNVCACVHALYSFLVRYRWACPTKGPEDDFELAQAPLSVAGTFSKLQKSCNDATQAVKIHENSSGCRGRRRRSCRCCLTTATWPTRCWLRALAWRCSQSPGRRFGQVCRGHQHGDGHADAGAASAENRADRREAAAVLKRAAGMHDAIFAKFETNAAASATSAAAARGADAGDSAAAAAGASTTAADATLASANASSAKTDASKAGKAVKAVTAGAAVAAIPLVAADGGAAAHSRVGASFGKTAPQYVKALFGSNNAKLRIDDKTVAKRLEENCERAADVYARVGPSVCTTYALSSTSVAPTTAAAAAASPPLRLSLPPPLQPGGPARGRSEDTNSCQIECSSTGRGGSPSSSGRTWSGASPSRCWRFKRRSTDTTSARRICAGAALAASAAATTLPGALRVPFPSVEVVGGGEDAQRGHGRQRGATLPVIQRHAADQVDAGDMPGPADRRRRRPAAGCSPDGAAEGYAAAANMQGLSSVSTPAAAAGGSCGVTLEELELAEFLAVPKPARRSRRWNHCGSSSTGSLPISAPLILCSSCSLPGFLRCTDILPLPVPTAAATAAAAVAVAAAVAAAAVKSASATRCSALPSCRTTCTLRRWPLSCWFRAPAPRCNWPMKAATIHCAAAIARCG